MKPLGKLIAYFSIAILTLFKIFHVFREQQLKAPMLIVYLILLIALIFAFLAYAPVLSPFIYPLF